MTRVINFIKAFKFSPRNEAAVKTAVLLVAAAMVTTALYSVTYSQNINTRLADNLIRLHVVANSDSPEDQALKLKVRDAVVEYMKAQLKDSRDIEQTKFIISRNLGKIEAIAREEIQKNSRDYQVKASLGVYQFPTKLYGDIALPAGSYQALRIVIGAGAGANWWCVLFPPLCFIDATHGTVPDSVKKDLKKVLSEEEYKLIVSADNDGEIPIKVKFKVVEFFQESKIKFSGMISSLFK
ncbi:MAG: stage II sporulation protein R [Clostridia bacterium]|nr:stage II sporulation protein R [Clostridia bacterium]